MTTSLIILASVIVLLALSVRIIQQQRVAVVERLGKFQRIMHPGLNLFIPIVDRVRVYHDLRIQQTNVPPQSVITRDNVQVLIDTIVFYQVVGPEQATYGIFDYVLGVRNITTATMRQIIGNLELDETLSGRERISAEIRTALDEATEKWGVRIERVEVIDIKPPMDIQEAMDKQMKAERNRRATILEAEAAKQDMILRAEGDKTSKILRAEGERASAELQALGQARAIADVAEAEKTRIRLLLEAGLDDRVLTYKSFEALEKIAMGPANKIFLPTAAVETLGNIGAIGDMLKSSRDTVDSSLVSRKHAQNGDKVS
ncbi:SPFH domain-containing protein [Rufibacter glacialis]|uniref:SPFH domain-containing protein n=1 Tax=Rufibacter glacialis TaxID=1259555 RepID=A0A5M8QLA2_9BACT|nr:SPFH domain-containing protein [Rufibacter glacialis]KAA6435754.1 SPFH/Band 7/PHB domain protein [Rufibacter glacialis]GGK66201.1 paraslipin [Rufibacter glacialis]